MAVIRSRDLTPSQECRYFTINIRPISCTEVRHAVRGEREREREAHFYFCRHAKFMVDEWPFEFLPGNSSLIFRIILASNFATVHAYPPPESAPIFRCFAALSKAYARIRVSAMGS